MVAGNLLVAGKLLTNPQRQNLFELTRLRLYEKMHSILNMAAQMSMKHQRFRDKYTKGPGNAMQHAVKGKDISVGFWVNVSKNIRQRFSKVRLNSLQIHLTASEFVREHRLKNIGYRELGLVTLSLSLSLL